MISGIQSANLKVGRVAVHLREINALMRKYTESEPDAFVRLSDGSYDVNFSKFPPPGISIIAGEAIYQLRSTLDHLAFDLVQRNSLNIQLPTRWDRECRFPLLIDIPSKGDPPVVMETPLPYNFFKKSLPGIPKHAFAFIESVQPYYGTDCAVALRYLEQLSNIDKHRYPHITKPHALRRDEATVRHKGDTLHGSSTVRVDHGTKSHSPMRQPGIEVVDVQVEADFATFVAFDETALGPNAPNLPINHVLQSCLDALELVVIPTFSEFLK